MRDYQVTYAVCALAAMAPATAFAEGSPSAAPASASVEEVVVTGSRISRQDYSASTPVVTLGPSTLQKTGAVGQFTGGFRQPGEEPAQLFSCRWVGIVGKPALGLGAQSRKRVICTATSSGAPRRPLLMS